MGVDQFVSVEKLTNRERMKRALEKCGWSTDEDQIDGALELVQQLIKEAGA